MATKTLNDMDRNLDHMRMQKAFRNDTSFSMIEKEKQRLAKVFQLPPILRMQSVQKSMNQRGNTLSATEDSLTSSVKNISEHQFMIQTKLSSTIKKPQLSNFNTYEL